jgi:hypothetical protein
MSRESRTGRKWATGEHLPFRDDLVAWPSPAPTEGEQARTADTMSADELRAELTRSREEIRRLQARVETLVEENTALRAR